jgi:uncharacterized protein YceK
MRTIVLALAAVTLMSACAGGARTKSRAPEQQGHATQQGAAFMGYHGPVWRANTPAD